MFVSISAVVGRFHQGNLAMRVVFLLPRGVNTVSIDYDIEVKKTGNPLVRITCNVCGEKFVLRGTLEKSGVITTGVKMCFCGNEDVEQTPIG